MGVHNRCTSTVAMKSLAKIGVMVNGPNFDENKTSLTDLMGISRMVC